MWWTKIVFTHIQYTLLFTIIKIKQNDSIVDRSNINSGMTITTRIDISVFHSTRLDCFALASCFIHRPHTRCRLISMDRHNAKTTSFAFSLISYARILPIKCNRDWLLVSKLPQPIPWLESTARGRLHRWTLDWKLRSLQQQSTQNE